MAGEGGLMANLDWPGRVADIAELARDVGLKVLAPAAREAERSGVPAKTWEIVFGTGLAASVGEELGGGGVLSPLEELIAVENLAYGDPGIALGAFRSGAAALLLGHHGSAEQAATLREVDATWRGSVAVHEGFGRSPDEYTTTVAVDGDVVRITGRKESVAFAAESDSIVVIGRDPASGSLQGAVVPSGTSGVAVSPSGPGLALGAVPTSTVTFDVTLPATALLGGGTADPVTLRRDVERIRLVLVAAMVGTAQRAVDYAGEYAGERVAFGRPIATFQGVSFLLADAVIRLSAARQVASDAAARLEAGDVEAAGELVTEALGYGAEVATAATRDAIQVLGGHGFIADHPVELWYRSAAALSVIDLDPLGSAFEPAL